MANKKNIKVGDTIKARIYDRYGYSTIIRKVQSVKSLSGKKRITVIYGGYNNFVVKPEEIISVKPKVSGVGKVIKNKKNKFGIDVEKPRDITLINDKIRDKIKKFKTLDPIQKAVRESNYLHTLSYTPAWKKDLTGNLLAVRRRTKIEYCKTVNTANKRLKELKINHVIFSKTCKL